MKVELSYAMQYHPTYKQHKAKALCVQKMLIAAGVSARKFLSFAPSVRVVIRPIRRGKMGPINGLYYNNLNLIELDVRNRTNIDILCTFMHELVHAEQYFTGKLSHLRNGKHDWEGRFTADITVPMSLEEYKKLPWEAEAYAREKELAFLVANDIATTVGYKLFVTINKG